MIDFNAQDAFARLVEDVRIGQVGRPMATHNPVGTRFIPHRLAIDLDLPVFHMVGDYHHIPMPTVIAAVDQIERGDFHLPYPRCAFMMSVPGDHPGLRHVAPRMRVRHSYIVVVEEDDEALHFIPFMQNDLIPHWVRQLFDMYIPLGKPLDVMVTYDPAWGDFPLDFIATVEISLWSRLQTILSFIHRMMGRQGSSTVVKGTVISDKIVARRTKMELPPIRQVITIDLDKLPSETVALGIGTGSPKKPHFRKGSWHTRKATGKRSWHPAVAVHGGGAIVPPWYEVRH